MIESATEHNFDFSHYYEIRKPAYFFGSKIIFYKEEVHRKNVPGCCVDVGMELFLEKENSNLKRLEEFADRNNCIVDAIYVEAYKPLAEIFANKPKLTRIKCTQFTFGLVEESRIEMPTPDGTE